MSNITITPPISLEDQTIDCPKCGKKNVVLHGNSTYVCIACGFRHDVADKTKEGWPSLLVAVASTLLLLALL